MKLIKPSVQIIDEPNITKRIEIAARTCYKSEDKITDGSADKMVKALIKRGHDSPLEHSNIVVETLTDKATKNLRNLIVEHENNTGLPAYIRNCGSDSIESNFDDKIWSGNLRAWRNIARRYCNEPMIQGLFSADPLFDDIFSDAVCFRAHADEIIKLPECAARVIDTDPLDRDRHKILTVRMITDRGVLAEITRHRLLSFSVESSRYCRYNGEDGITYVEPWWYEEGVYTDKSAYESILRANNIAYDVMDRFDKPMAQKSRAAMNHSTKTEIVATGTWEYWKNIIIPLRTSSAAHPDIARVVNMVKEAMSW
jgi:thymidylate synthase (FAD)